MRTTECLDHDKMTQPTGKLRPIFVTIFATETKVYLLNSLQANKSLWYNPMLFVVWP